MPAMIDYTSTKVCKTCHIEKPLTDFYGSPGSKDKHAIICKECAKAYFRQSYPTLNRNQRDSASGRPTENFVISKLRSLGIFATSGKASEFKWCDVVAWGCVTIEVKTSALPKDKKFKFNFTPVQQKRGIQAALMLLVCDYGNVATFHMFPSDHPVFYHSDGTLKKGLGYTPGTLSQKMLTNNIALTKTLMTQYENNWGLIEKCRLEWR